MSATARWLAVVVATLAPAAVARAQTMLDQEQRLIDIHSLLLVLPPVSAPADLAPRSARLGLEIIGVPPIDGTTGTKRQITASDQVPAFPRPRLDVALPFPGRDDLRLHVGIAYVPPLTVRDVSAHVGAAELGLAWVAGPWHAELRGQVVVAQTLSPVTERDTRDRLNVFATGGDLSVGRDFDLGFGHVMPYVGGGVAYTNGLFRVTSDGVELRSHEVVPALDAGARLLAFDHWEATAELEALPRRMVHPSFRVAYVLGF